VARQLIGLLDKRAIGPTNTLRLLISQQIAIGLNMAARFEPRREVTARVSDARFVLGD